MSLESATEAVQKKVASSDKSLGSTIKFAFDEGVIFVDGSAEPMTVSNEDRDADCTIRMSLGDFEDMVAGETDPTMAYMTGKLKVEGDMGVAMKLSSVI